MVKISTELKILQEQLSKSDEITLQLQLECEQSAVRIKDELDKFYNSLDRVTLRDSSEHISAYELRDFKRNIKYYMNDNITESWRKELSEYLDRVRVSKFEVLTLTIQHELNRLSKLEEDLFEEMTEEIYEDTYYKNLYEFSKSIQITKEYSKLDTSKIKKLHDKPWADDYKNRHERIWARNILIYRRMYKELVRSIKSEQHSSKAHNIVNNIIDYNKNRIRGLSIGETIYYVSNAQKQVYDDTGVEKYQIIATLDDRTSEICQDMDLEVFDMKDYSVGITAPPFHMFCRTVTIPYLSDSFTERFARDGDNIYYIDKDISYKEWYENYVK